MDSTAPCSFELREWYIARCEELGQSTFGKIPCVYNSFPTASRSPTPTACSTAAAKT